MSLHQACMGVHAAYICRCPWPTNVLCFKFLSRTCPSYEPISNDTPLLQVIKTALCGSDTENVSSIQTATFSPEMIRMNARQPRILILWQ